MTWGEGRRRNPLSMTLSDIVASPQQQGVHAMRITNMRTNALENPLGHDLDGLTLSWRVTDTDAVKTRAAWVRIARAFDFLEEALVFDSGRRADIHASGFHPDVALQPGTRYWWKVWIEGDNGNSAGANRPGLKRRKPRCSMARRGSARRWHRMCTPICARHSRFLRRWSPRG
jgi:hypothetical protein